MRYTAAAMRIQERLLDFQFDWNELQGPKGSGANLSDPAPKVDKQSDPRNNGTADPVEPAHAVTLFELARHFCADVVHSVSDETEKWAAEFSDSVAHFETQLPGSSLLRRRDGK
jgi:hypothetical protein